MSLPAGPPLIQSTDLVSVLPRSLTGTLMHLPTLADFGIFGAWDGALLSLWLFVAAGLCRTLARAFRRHVPGPPDQWLAGAEPPAIR